jgi:hypothetical protein
MVPRLERHRDSVLSLAEAELKEAELLFEKLKGHSKFSHRPDLTNMLKSNLDALRTIVEDLGSKRYFRELSSRFFAYGSIVRVFLIAMLANSLILFLAVTSAASTPYFSLWGNALARASEADPSAVVHAKLIDYLAVFSILVTIYTVFSISWYVQLWKLENNGLVKLKTQATNASGHLKLAGHMLEGTK